MGFMGYMGYPWLPPRKLRRGRLIPPPEILAALRVVHSYDRVSGHDAPRKQTEFGLGNSRAALYCSRLVCRRCAGVLPVCRDLSVGHCLAQSGGCHLSSAGGVPAPAAYQSASRPCSQAPLSKECRGGWRVVPTPAGCRPRLFRQAGNRHMDSRIFRSRSGHTSSRCPGY